MAINPKTGENKKVTVGLYELKVGQNKEACAAIREGVCTCLFSQFKFITDQIREKGAAKAYLNYVDHKKYGNNRCNTPELLKEKEDWKTLYGSVITYFINDRRGYVQTQMKEVAMKHLSGFPSHWKPKLPNVKLIEAILFREIDLD